MGALDDFFADADLAALKRIPTEAFDHSDDAEYLARLLANTRRLIGLLKDAAEEVENELVNTMPEKKHTVSFGELEKHSGAQRKAWDHDSLISVAAHAIGDTEIDGVLVNGNTGEPIDHVSLTHAILKHFREMATPSWKVTGLRDNGIDPSEFCQTSWGRKTVTVPTINERKPLEG